MVFNFFNPRGIPIVREKPELQWASDSLFLDVEQNKQTEPDQLPLPIMPDQKKDLTEEKQAEKNPESEDIKPGPIEQKKVSEEKKETITFSEPKAITLEQAFTLFNRGVKFIDARDESDYISGHIANSISIPFDDFDNHKQKLEAVSREEPVIIYCAGTECDLSIMLGNLLFGQGFKQVYIFFGGWDDWVNAGYPVEYGKNLK